MRWRDKDIAKVRSKCESWRDYSGVHYGEVSKLRRRSMWLILRNAETTRTPSPRGWKHHECQSVRGDYDGDNSCGREWYRLTVLKCNRGVSTAEPNGGTLEANIGGCDWEMQLIFIGNDYMPVIILYLKGPCWFVVTKYLHTWKPNTWREQYLKIKNI